MDGSSSHFSVSLSFLGTQVFLLLTKRGRAVTVRQNPVVDVCRTFWQKTWTPALNRLYIRNFCKKAEKVVDQGIITIAKIEIILEGILDLNLFQSYSIVCFH